MNRNFGESSLIAPPTSKSNQILMTPSLKFLSNYALPTSLFHFSDTSLAWVIVRTSSQFQAFSLTLVFLKLVGS